ncbi:protease SohB [Colwellia sp. 4_MG-2023]|uniref:protease SohB n=1 Tax=unclassified Colwellia TaxID=196834 RepID=UPI001C0825AB|nr:MULTISPECIES: protease SohB [unclassified Colwellia]MBU2925663.1 protease SohB [Colwellia sp. C2M11]MDO6487854.1 protease SohB [Colwellia sp. 6_MG-2023]MDO6507489.1 protease SohB [Colwellia sp. 5_MG-2023]MDO6556253.1 protease SohB [Colwellia sp. 4_MG-2023]MDO6651111.1 protease SohB [Colwellia sp. 3_MG-2023]
MEFLYEYGLFLAKTITFVIAVVAIVVLATASAIKHKHKKGELEITDLSEQFEEVEQEIVHALLNDEELKQKEKKDKKLAKEKAKADKALAKQKEKSDDETETKSKPKVFVLDFKGSIDAKEVSSLREEVSAILSVATKDDEVFVRLESGGGMVHGYGLASSQLDRIRQHEIPLTVSVDKVAASGGYMMACVANNIIAAPFAILGSIGVIAQLPNFNKLLKKNDIDFEQFTAGEFKRTVTMFGENTEKGKEKFIEELEETHVLFKDFVSAHRPSLDLAKVATGEHWFGTTALALGLVDSIQTSDDYLQNLSKSHKIVAIKYEVKKGLAEKFSKAASLSVDGILGKLMQKNRIFPG